MPELERILSELVMLLFELGGLSFDFLVLPFDVVGLFREEDGRRGIRTTLFPEKVR